MWMLFDAHTGNAIDFTDSHLVAAEWERWREQDDSLVVIEWDEEEDTIAVKPLTPPKPNVC